MNIIKFIYLLLILYITCGVAQAQDTVDLFKQIKLKLPNTKVIEMKPRHGVIEVWVTTTDGKSYYLLGDKLVEMEHPDVTKAKMEILEKSRPWYRGLF